MRYLCISTMVSPEVCVYPDADKVSALVKGKTGWRDGLFKFFRANEAVGYFDGEESE